MRTVLDILKKDHQEVKALLHNLAETTTRAEKTRTELLEQIERELQVHTKVEEEIFYPAVREAAKNNGQREKIAEALEEHRAVEDRVLPDLKAVPVTSVEFGGRAKVLKELVEHHAEEEEKELFPLAKELLGEERLSELSDELMARKQQLLRKLGAA